MTATFMYDITPSFSIYMSKLTHYNSIRNMSGTILVWTLTQCFTHIWSYTTPNMLSPVLFESYHQYQ
jgi:hypothetical protein